MEGSFICFADIREPSAYSPQLIRFWKGEK